VLGRGQAAVVRDEHGEQSEAGGNHERVQVDLMQEYKEPEFSTLL
jgi:hypothetical protein